MVAYCPNANLENRSSRCKKTRHTRPRAIQMANPMTLKSQILGRPNEFPPQKRFSTSDGTSRDGLLLTGYHSMD